jgi:hydroxymethylpyrimidine pyrophosphatase-like HAD family hydrolase
LKNTYLAKKQNDDGMFVLEEISGEQWREIVQRNKSLSKEQKRYFISDCIEESDDIDRMYIEVSYEEYKKWNVENTLSAKNRKYKKNFTIVSFDEFVLKNKDLSDKDILIDKADVENEAIENINNKELIKALSEWQPWALDIYKAYISGRKTACTREIASKYNVSLQTARSYKRKFKSFLKKFLK